MLKLLGRTSSINVRKALWAAAETGADFVHEGDWGGGRHTDDPEFQALNPNKLVPVLVTEEGPLWESNTICRYLATAADRSDLLPRLPFARAEVEKWMDWQATDLNNAWRPAFMALVREDTSISRAEILRSIDAWNAMMLILERRLDDTALFVTGPVFTLADIVLGLSVQRWLLTPISRPDTPALVAYRERLLARPAAARWISRDVP
jgi:glutathione S-transferase